MLQCRCGQQTIDCRQGTPRRGDQPPPPICHRNVDRQNASGKESGQISFQPVKQILPARSVTDPFDPFANFTQGQNA